MSHLVGVSNDLRANMIGFSESGRKCKQINCNGIEKKKPEHETLKTGNSIRIIEKNKIDDTYTFTYRTIGTSFSI